MADSSRVQRGEKLEFESFRIPLQFRKEQLDAFEKNPRQVLEKVLAGPLAEQGIDKINDVILSQQMYADIRQAIATGAAIIPVVAHCILPPKMFSRLIILND